MRRPWLERLNCSERRSYEVEEVQIQTQAGLSLKPWLLTAASMASGVTGPQNPEEGRGQGCDRVASTDPDASWM